MYIFIHLAGDKTSDTVRIFHYILILLLMFAGSLSAQNKVIHELKQTLATKKDSIGYVNVLNQLGMQYHLSNADSCFLFSVQARDIATRLKYKKGMADGLNNLSIFYALKANMKQAIEYDYKALLLYRQLGDSANVCQVLMNSSVYYNYEGSDPIAEIFLQQAMNMGKHLPNDSIYGLVLINYAIHFGGDSLRQDSVLWAIQKAKEILAKYPGSRNHYYIEAIEADEWMKRGEADRAVKRINQLADQAISEGLIFVGIDMLEHIETYTKNGHNTDIIPYKEKIFALAEQAGYTDLILPAITSLYHYYANKKDAAKTATYGKELYELVRRRQEMNNNIQVNHLDYFLKEQALTEWQLSNKVQKEKIAKTNMKKEHRQILIGLLSGVLLLLGGFTFTRYRSYRNLRQQELLMADMNTAISEKNKQLQINDDFKNKLIAIIANDFREPLNNIIKVAVMFRNNAGKEVLQELIDQVDVSSRNTLVVFDNILRWIKSQLSGFVYSPMACPLLPFFEEILQGMAPALITRQISVGLNIADDILLAGESEMLQFVNRSLLYYAASFSPDNHTIGIMAVKEAHQVKVTLTSTAPEVTAEMAAHLFVHQEGITMVICKDFMDKMGGQIWAEKTETQLQLVYTLPSFN
ncbi:Signal transduction histidine kinase [Chitinophaga sp. YR573]|uniref:sensor histidine kinase n=1 Tax=Chitinophaga sp. YR573 TaxID=1881040 RepID=UPI0008BA0161|nr:HAMP domain-containing histidine kinase [Chitinophaga sp. YR573]SEV98544.1 Signal transduction histidine kinase [Chitinophaga sp. YR573]